MDPRAKAHLYMSEYQVSDDRCQAGQRRQCPIELEIDLHEAINGGFVAFRSRAGAILSCMDLPREFITSAVDTHQKAVLWHRTLRETEAERISQEFATDQPEGAHPRGRIQATGASCPECSSEQISGTAQCNVCGYLFDVEPEVKGTQQEIEAAKREWVSHRREMTLRRKEKQAAMLRKLGFDHAAPHPPSSGPHGYADGQVPHVRLGRGDYDPFHQVPT